MKTIIFATANPGKLRQAQDVIRSAHVKGCPIDFDEPRSDDLRTIARAKLRQPGLTPCINQKGWL